MFKNICNERLDKIEELTKEIDYNDLNFIVQSSNDETDLTGIKDHLDFFDDIRNYKLTLRRAKNLLKECNEYLKK